MSSSTEWARAQLSINQQRYQEASDVLTEYLQRLRGVAGRELEAASVFARIVALRVGLHGFASAVKMLREEPSPTLPLPRLLLELLQAQTLQTYGTTYSWMLRAQPAIEGDGADPERWNSDRVQLEASRALQRAWSLRAQVGEASARVLGELVHTGNYPEHLRGTVFDVLAYLAASVLANSSHWSTEETSGLYRLSIDRLLGSFQGETSIALDEVSVHPLERACRVLDELQRWHEERGQHDAVLGVVVERHRMLFRVISEREDRLRVLQSLERSLEHTRAISWKPYAYSVLGQCFRDAGLLVRARDTVLKGASLRDGDAYGQQRCEALRRELERGSLQVQAMLSDGPKRRSLQVTYRNLTRVWVRAYAKDLATTVLSAKDYQLLPIHPEWSRLLQNEVPTAVWTVELEATTDLQSHVQYVVPPLEKPGLYVLIVSPTERFEPVTPELTPVACNFLVTGMVLLSEAAGDGSVELTVVHGENGAPIPGVSVQRGTYDYSRRGHRLSSTQVTDARGSVRFAPEQGSFFYLAKKDHDAALLQSIASNAEYQAPASMQSLVYFDRAIYRPGQKLFFKVLVYLRSEGEPRALPGTAGTATLFDPNGQALGTVSFTTNDFATASGMFVLPEGRPLGTWRVDVSTGASMSFRVEEYKRPSFEVEWKPLAQAPRLNEKLRCEGTAKYYFGGALTGGSVRWKATRVPKLPPWGFWFFATQPKAERVASGVAVVDEQGTFVAEFTPEVDPRKAKIPGLTYEYELSADVTDEGGETRTAKSVFRVGFAAVDGLIEGTEKFAVEQLSSRFAFLRTSLDGQGREGTGQWKLFSVQQPAGGCPGPADLPPANVVEEETERQKTEGDRLLPRWESNFDPERVLARYSDGALLAEGQCVHPENGRAELLLPPLPAGVYRLRYETQDDRGVKVTAEKTFVCVGKSTPVALPAVLMVQSSTVKVGATVRVFAASGTYDQVLFLDFYSNGVRVDRKVLEPGAPELMEFQAVEANRGGFAVTLTAVRDFQKIFFTQTVFVPWDHKELQLSFETFREVMAPGERAFWRVVLRGSDGKTMGTRAAELLAFMYDKSLDALERRSTPTVLSLFPSMLRSRGKVASLSVAHGNYFLPSPPTGAALGDYDGASFHKLDRYGVGGPGIRGGYQTTTGSFGIPPPAPAMAPGGPPQMAGGMDLSNISITRANLQAAPGFAKAEVSAPAVVPRTNFAETAFFFPQLTTNNDGSIHVEFNAPDSATGWVVWMHAVTRDLCSASVSRAVRTLKAVLVRPYVPRFFREGDAVELRVMVNNTTPDALQGTVHLRVEDPTTGIDLSSWFSLETGVQAVQIPANGSATSVFSLRVPSRLGLVSVRAEVRAGAFVDGEVRTLPVLPARVRLLQTRFVALRGPARAAMQFEEMARGDDPTLRHEQMVLGVDAQLFLSVLRSLPSLVRNTNECSETVALRWAACGMMEQLYKRYPQVAAMAKSLGARGTPRERFDEEDPNRKMTLEETPWLREAQGAGAFVREEDQVADLLSEDVLLSERERSRRKLERTQTDAGGWPWCAGGEPSPTVTLWVLEALARGKSFGATVPQKAVDRAWSYLGVHFRKDLLPRLRRGELQAETLLYLAELLTMYPEESSRSGSFTAEERAEIVQASWQQWRSLSPRCKVQLSLLLAREGRVEDAQVPLLSVLDAAKTDPTLGTYWAPEERAWHWYQDSVETHALVLRAVQEVLPQHQTRSGMLLWLLLNKKLNVWKSTRATALALQVIAREMEAEGSLGVREHVRMSVGERSTDFYFEPGSYQGKVRWVLPGEELQGASSSVVQVEHFSPGTVFASAAWHFSTEREDLRGSGDLLWIDRAFYRVDRRGTKEVLVPLSSQMELRVGDEVCVELTLRAKHAASYVQLKDPRPGGFEPVETKSGWRFDGGVTRYEEVRDSGRNLYFEALPAGEYVFRHLLRATLAGRFRAHPALLQSVYAPEFAAYSTGGAVEVESS